MAGSRINKLFRNEQNQLVSENNIRRGNIPVGTLMSGMLFAAQAGSVQSKGVC